MDTLCISENAAAEGFKQRTDLPEVRDAGVLTSQYTMHHSDLTYCNDMLVWFVIYSCLSGIKSIISPTLKLLSSLNEANYHIVQLLLNNPIPRKIN